MVEADAPIAETHADGGLDRGVIGNIGVGCIFDMPDESVEDLRRLGIGRRIHRMHLHRRLHLPRVVDDLADEGRQAVDRETRAPLQLPLADDLLRPLLAEARETNVVARGFAVVALGIGGAFESFLGVGKDVGFRHV